MDNKVCIKCSETKHISLFENSRNVCRACRLVQTQLVRGKKRVVEISITSKQCNMCLTCLSSDKFNKYSLSNDGLHKFCKDCYKKSRYKKTQVLAPKLDVIITCTECNKEKTSDNYRSNKRSLTGFFNKCNECWKPSSITKEKRREYEVRYREKYPDKVKQKYKIQGQKLQRRVKDRLRARITSAFGSINYKKSMHTIDYLGCSINYLKKWLESQFVEGMSWNNYSDWHIDHVNPCEQYDLTKTDEQLKCFNWKNLRPCWKQENLTKGAKVINELIEKQMHLANEYERINPLPTQPGDRAEGTE